MGDQKAFDYVSDCASTHLLAADMKTGNFSVSLTYADPIKRGDMNSINVILGENNIVISGDYSVTMGGKKQQLPFNIDQVMVSREGNTVHVRRSDDELDVACNFMTQLCTVNSAKLGHEVAGNIQLVIGATDVDCVSFSADHNLINVEWQLLFLSSHGDGVISTDDDVVLSKDHVDGVHITSFNWVSVGKGHGEVSSLHVGCQQMGACAVTDVIERFLIECGEMTESGYEEVSLEWR